MSPTEMGRDDLICVPGMMGYDGVIYNLPASRFANIGHWPAKMIVDVHRASAGADASGEYPVAGIIEGRDREDSIMAPGGAELLDQPFHSDAPEAEGAGDQALRDEIMGDDGDEWSASDVQIDEDEDDDVGIQGIIEPSNDNNPSRYDPHRYADDQDFLAHGGENATDADSEEEDGYDYSARGSPISDIGLADAEGMLGSSHDMSLDEQDDGTASGDGQAVPTESTGHTSSPGLPFREPTQNIHTGAAVDVIDLTAEADEPQEAASLRPALQALYRIDTLPPRELPMLCLFFAASSAEIENGLFTIPGTIQPLTAGQLAFIYQFIKRSVGINSKINGQILADATGLGKSHCIMGLIAIIRLLVLTVAHVEEHPDQHNGLGSSSSCPSGDPYGVQCVCVSGSPSSEYARRLTKGPMLVLTPPHIVEQWVAKAADYYLPTVTAKGSDRAKAFVDLLSWTNGSLVSHPFGNPEMHVIDDAATAAGPVMVGIMAGGGRISQKDYKRLKELKDSKPYMAVDWLRKSDKVLFKANFEELSVGDQSKCIVFASTSAVSQGRLAAGLSKNVALAIAGRSSPYIVPFPLPIVPTLVAYDECHTIKDGSSKFWQQLFNLRQLARHGELRSQWCFLSATPASANPLDIAPICSMLFEGASRDVTIDSLRELNAQFTQMQCASGRGEDTHQQGVTFATRFGRFLEDFVIARDRSSPILGRSINDPGPRYHKVSWSVSVPADHVDDVEQLGTFCREKLPKDEGQLNMMRTLITTEPVFTQYYAAGIMPGIATAQVRRRAENRSYPSSAPDIAKDIGRKERGTLYRFMHAHEGHEWLTRLASVLNLAYNDRGPDADERPKHVLVLAATPSLTGHIFVNIANNAELQPITSVKLLTSGSESARQRHERIGAISVEAAASDKTTVVVSTAELVGTGTDTLTFCNYLVILGELFKPVHEDQAIGRLCRRGQRLPVHVHFIRSNHHTHELIRKRNSGRRLMLSDLGSNDADADEM